MRVVKAVLALLAIGVMPVARGATYVVPPDRVLVRRADSIVVARAVHSYVDDSRERGIETITVFAIEEILKDDSLVSDGFRVRIPGGVVQTDDGQKRFKVIPGAPQFADGERLLLFLSQTPDNDYVTTGFALGVFSFATDDLGRRVIVRIESEIRGWDLDNSPHREARRLANPFLKFIRETAAGRRTADDYTVDVRPIVGESGSAEATGSPKGKALTCDACSVKQYSVGTTETSSGFRWNTFPSAVSWNRGNLATNAPGNGSDAINAAFAAWNSDAGSNVSYSLTTTNANFNGIHQAADGVNNVVFEDNFFSDYSCSSGGLLGLGGIHGTSGTSTVGGESFINITEADVSMNKGVNACIGTSLSVANFNTAIAHEFGHTLGLRHADTSRDGAQSCYVMTNYDCSMSAIMTAAVTEGLNAALQPWDQRAVTSLYPSAGSSLAPPSGVVAAATSSTTVGVAWNVVTAATSYQVYRTGPASGGSYGLVGTTSNTSFSDSGVAENSAYLYRVRAVNDYGTSPDSLADLATTVVFSDDPIISGQTAVKVDHLTELRRAVSSVRSLAGLTVFTFTDAVPLAGVTSIRSAHIVDLRSALDDARVLLGMTPLSYTDQLAAGTLIKAIHFMELRNALR